MNLAKSFFNIIRRLFRHNKTEELGQGIEQEQVTEREDSTFEAGKKSLTSRKKLKEL